MTQHQAQAIALFEGGCQCAQAVFAALCDETGLDQPTALALSASFGGGIGRMREMCGALCGALMALGSTLGHYPPGDSAGKDRHYRLTQYAAACFRRQMHSIYCYELLDLPRGAQIPVSQPRDAAFYQKRPCVAAILAAVQVFDEIMTWHRTGKLEALITPEAAEATTRYLNSERA